MNTAEEHIADTLYETHCRIAFLQAATSAFAELSDDSILPQSCAWMGLNFILMDILEQVNTTKTQAQTWQPIP
ncbi:MAG: hypothetical protein RRY29_07710 [Desulfovibrionaceae bacterium]